MVKDKLHENDLSMPTVQKYSPLLVLSKEIYTSIAGPKTHLCTKYVFYIERHK